MAEEKKKKLYSAVYGGKKHYKHAHSDKQAKYLFIKDSQKRNMKPPFTGLVVKLEKKKGDSSDSNDLFLDHKSVPYDFLAEIVSSGHSVRDVLLEKKKLWTGKVKTKWSPPGGLFTKSSGVIVKELKKGHSTLKGAMSALNFFINRAGKNLSSERKAELEKTKDKLKKEYV